MSTLRKVRHTLSKTPVRVPLVWMRHRGFRPTDVFVGSYPRSGSTWLRFMLLEILAGQASGFNNTNEMLPDVGKHEAGAEVLPGSGRLIKTHEAFRPEYKKAIYLVRDPRDVALSEFAYQTALGFANDEFDSYLERFMRTGVNPFCSWIDHVNSWLDAADRQRGDILHVNFEELKQNPVQQLSRIADFLRVPEVKARIPAAIENNSLARMKEKEKATPQRASAKGRFIRSGSAGGWRATFTEGQAQLVQQYAGPVLARLGYPEIHSLEGQFA
ncbi:MAG TPA: sulfotransferase domain-containing protein [Candidatus Binatia bacterium]|nr:sulfotransferase domain-containing protein [Candidatus Binatia bacterium]